MIIGVGTDIVSVARVEKACEKESFLRAVYTEQEQTYARSRGKGEIETLAGMFAAKEAVAKALGTGFNGFFVKDIEILHNEAGQPQVAYHGQASVVVRKNGIDMTHLSISHEREMAVAYVIVERRGGSVCSG